MINIVAVSYINTWPFIYGIEHSDFLKNEYQLIKAFPSACTKAYVEKKGHIVLLPSGSIDYYNQDIIISGFCIGSNSRVESVLLLSHVPREEITSILLDYQSTTSVKLIQIITKFFWNKTNFHFIQTTNEEALVPDKTSAVLLIGDRALLKRKQYPFVYDLAEEWLKATNTPFVFAFWAKNQQIDKLWIDKFNNALNWGINHIKDCIELYNPENKNEIYHYLTSNISFTLDNEKIKGLKLFYDLCKKI